MAKYHISKTNSPILFYMIKSNLSITDICKALEITKPTLRLFIMDSTNMRLKQIICLSGLFGIKVEVLVYLLIRNKTQIRSKDRVDNWYIENVLLEGEGVMSSLPGEKNGDSPQNP